MSKFSHIILAIFAMSLLLLACNGNPTLSETGDQDYWADLVTDQSVDQIDSAEEVPQYECTIDSDCTAGKACINHQCRTVTQTGDSDTVDQLDVSEQAKACYTAEDCLDLLGDCEVVACLGADPNHGLFGQCYVTDDPRCAADTDSVDTTDTTEQDSESNTCICDPDIDLCTRDYCDEYGICRHDRIPNCVPCLADEHCAGISTCNEGDRVYTHPTYPSCELLEAGGIGRCTTYREDCELGCFDGQCIEPSEGDTDSVDNYEQEIDQDEASEQDYYVACSSNVDCETFGLCDGQEAIRGNECVNDESGSGRHCSMIYEWCADSCEFGVCVNDTGCTMEQRVCDDGSDAWTIQGTCDQVCPEDNTHCNDEFCRTCTEDRDCQEDTTICQMDRDRLVYLEGFCVEGACSYHTEPCHGFGCGEVGRDIVCHDELQPEGDTDNIGEYEWDELPYSPDGVTIVLTGCDEAFLWWGGHNGEQRVNCNHPIFLSNAGICGWGHNYFEFNDVSYHQLIHIVSNPELTVTLIPGLQGTTKRRATLPYLCGS